MFSALQDSLQGWWDGGTCTHVGTHTHGHTYTNVGGLLDTGNFQRHLLVFSGPEAPLACSNAYII